MTTQNVIKAIERLKTAYENKDMTTIQSNVVSNVANSLKSELSFKEATLSFSSPRFVKISDDSIRVTQSWQGEWLINTDKLRNSGVSKLIFMREPLKLLQIEGDNPFIIPGRDKR